MGRILRVEIVVLSASTAIVSVRRRNLQNLDPHGLNKAKQAGPITAGGLDPNPLDLTEGTHPGEHLSVALPGRGKASAPQNTVAFIDDGRDMQILVGVHAANDMSLCLVPGVDPLTVGIENLRPAVPRERFLEGLHTKLRP